VFTPEQKARMIATVTDAMVAIEGEAMRGVTWVVIEDVKEGAWGIGGQGLTSEDVRRLQAGRT
jgi:4-oxalocrotonate tautomerase